MDRLGDIIGISAGIIVIVIGGCVAFWVLAFTIRGALYYTGILP